MIRKSEGPGAAEPQKYPATSASVEPLPWTGGPAHHL